MNVLEDTGGSGVNVSALEDRVKVLEITANYHAHRLTTAEEYIDGNRPEYFMKNVWVIHSNNK